MRNLMLHGAFGMAGFGCVLALAAESFGVAIATSIAAIGVAVLSRIV